MVYSQNSFSEKSESFIKSFNLNRAKNNLKNLDESEEKLLFWLIDYTPCVKNGLDLNWSGKDWSNDYLAKCISRTKETVRRAKESLHARGIILIDGLYYDEYFDKHGNKLRTSFRQHVKFTQEFINFISQNVNICNIDISEPFNHHPVYLAAKAIRDQRSKESKIAWVIRAAQRYLADKMENVENSVNNMLKSCDNEHMEYVASGTHEARMEYVANSRQDENSILTKNKLLNSSGDCFQMNDKSLENQFGNISRAISSIVQSAETKIKKWTEATSRICDSLMQSGKTHHDVGLIMIQQKYVNSYREFAKIYPPPIT